MAIELKVIGPNQTEVRVANKVLFFSYNTLVAVLDNGNYYRTVMPHSKTTSKHLNKWCVPNAFLVSQNKLEEIANA